jgi:hypothetical protein
MFEAFQAALLTDTAAFLPEILPARAGDDQGPTLDAALAQAGSAARAAPADWTPRFAELLQSATSQDGSREAGALFALDELARPTAPGGAARPGAGGFDPSVAIGPAEGEGEGADEEEEIVVNGVRPQTPDGSGGGGATTGSGNGEGQEGNSEGSGDNGAGDQGNDCRDRKALEAKTLINGEPDDGYKEHGIVLYRGADGSVQKSTVLEGTASQIPISVITEWMTNNGISFSQIIGFVHNHDAWYYAPTPDGAAINRYPSNNDWNTANWMVANGAGGPNGDGFALYVIDTDGDMREFEYQDRATYQSLDGDDKKAGTDLPDETTGDGTSCG